MRECSVEGCPEKHKARGFCMSHYHKASKEGLFKRSKRVAKHVLSEIDNENMTAYCDTHACRVELYESNGKVECAPRRTERNKRATEAIKADPLRRENRREYQNSYQKEYRWKSVEAEIGTRDSLLKKCGRKCEICNRDVDLDSMRIDHDHSCCPKGSYCKDCVRGVLCNGCNSGLGMFLDNPDSLTAAVVYVKSRSIAYRERPFLGEVDSIG